MPGLRCAPLELLRLETTDRAARVGEAGYAALPAAASAAAQRHVEAERPGELIGIDCFFVGRLSGTKGAVWQLTAIDVCFSYAGAELVSCPQGNPTVCRPPSSPAASPPTWPPPAGGSSAC